MSCLVLLVRCWQNIASLLNPLRLVLQSRLNTPSVYVSVHVCVQAKAGITDDIIEVLTATSADLSKGRRKRPMPPGLAAPGSFDHYKMLSSHPLHKTSEVRTVLDPAMQ